SAVLTAYVGTCARCDHKRRHYYYLGIEPPDGLTYYDRDDFYPDALPCLAELRRRGFFLGVAGNQSDELEAWIRAQELDVDLVASSARWGVEKLSPAFFDRVVSESGLDRRELGYVRDCVDNDVVPARGGGLVAVHL